MRRIFFIFFILLAAILLGLFVYSDPGYVLIVYRSWSIETTLWAALVIIILLYLILHTAANTLRWFRSLGFRLRAWSRQKQWQKANLYTMDGLHKWLEGRWDVSEKRLIKAIKYTKTPLINYLAAARAAQEKGDLAKRDTYIKKAYDSSPAETIAISLTYANLQLEANQWDKALSTLRPLKKAAPENAYFLKLLCRAYLNNKDWGSIKQILPALHKSKALPDKILAGIEEDTYKALLQEEAAKAKDFASIESFWDQIPKEHQCDIDILLVYTRALVKNNQPAAAEKILNEAIKKKWDSRLLDFYGNLPGVDYVKQLIQAEGWLAKHEHDSALLLCLGRLCRKQRLWGKAKNYLEAALSFAPAPATYRELGLVMEMLDNKNAALEYYRKGLKASTETLD